MKKFYFSFFLFAFITTNSQGQGVSSGYIIDSVVISEYYESIAMPRELHHPFGVDSFDINGLIRSSYTIDSNLIPFSKYRTLYHYSNSNKLLAKTNEEWSITRWRKSSEKLFQYDSLDRNIDVVEWGYYYGSNYLNDSALSKNGNHYHFEYNAQGLQTQVEYRNIYEGKDSFGHRFSFSYYEDGKPKQRKYEYWYSTTGYRLDKIENYEYGLNDSLKKMITANYYSNLLSGIDETNYVYGSDGYLSFTIDSAFNPPHNLTYVSPPTFHTYNQQHQKIIVESPLYKTFYTYNTNGFITMQKEYERQDSSWILVFDSTLFFYNARNQLLKVSGYWGYDEMEYDSTGFNNYYEHFYCGYHDCNEYKQYFSYKKLLHPNAIPEENTFTLFPNPTDGNFSLIYFSSIDEPITIKVHNALGQLVFQETENKTAGYFRENFNLGKFSNGIYYLEFTSSSKRATKKILVE